MAEGKAADEAPEHVDEVWLLKLLGFVERCEAHCRD